MRAAAWRAAIVGLSGCFSELLEAPYVLATGLPPATALSPSGRGSLLVAARDGVWEIEGGGARSRIWRGEATGVTAHRSGFYVLDQDGVSWGPLPEPGSEAVDLQRQVTRGALDALAWCDDLVLLLYAGEIRAWLPWTGEIRGWAQVPPDAARLALGRPPDCSEALVMAGDRLLSVVPSGAAEELAVFPGLRAAAVDEQGAVWVVHGAPPVLSRLGDPEPFARHLGDPRDLHFGTGGLFPPANAYLAGTTGTLDYVHVPP